MANSDEETVDEDFLDALALAAASYLRRRGGALPVSAVIEGLVRKGVSPREAEEAIDHGLRTGTLAMLKTKALAPGIVRGFL